MPYDVFDFFINGRRVLIIGYLLGWFNRYYINQKRGKIAVTGVRVIMGNFF